MAVWRMALLFSLVVSIPTGVATAGNGFHRGKCCHPHGHCCACNCGSDSDRSSDFRGERNLPMVLPIIETAPVFASPVALASQRTLVVPQLQNRAAVLRADEAYASVERMEKLERQVSDLADSFDELREVVLQQARILNEISKRLPEK